jgi:hypothetical protein
MDVLSINFTPSNQATESELTDGDIIVRSPLLTGVEIFRWQEPRWES